MIAAIAVVASLLADAFLFAALAELFANAYTGDAPQAVGVVRALMFIERFCADIDARIDNLQSPSAAPAHGQGAAERG